MKTVNKYKHLYNLTTLGSGYTEQDILDYNYKKNWNECNKHIFYYFKYSLCKRANKFNVLNTQDVENLKQYLIIHLIKTLKTDVLINDYKKYVCGIFNTKVLDYKRGLVQQNFEDSILLVPDFDDEKYVDLVEYDNTENYEFTDEFREELDSLRFGGIRKLLKDRDYSTKQKAIVYLMMDGCGSKEIAETLRLSERYVRKISIEAIGFIKNLIYEGCNYSSK